MDPIVAVKLIELGIIGLQGAFTLMSMAGKTPEEIDVIYLEEKMKFKANKPADLLDV